MKRAALEILVGLWVALLSPLWVPFVVLALVAMFLRVLGRAYIANHVRTRREMDRAIDAMTARAFTSISLMVQSKESSP